MNWKYVDLRASTMVEVITASVIFLVLFVMTMDTLTRLAVNKVCKVQEM
jgi:hypothetical protein